VRVRTRKTRPYPHPELQITLSFRVIARNLIIFRNNFT
jgi:hypothetical protein